MGASSWTNQFSLIDGEHKNGKKTTTKCSKSEQKGNVTDWINSQSLGMFSILKITFNGMFEIQRQTIHL